MIEKLFERFLANNGIKDKFEKNLKKESNVTIEKHLALVKEYGAPEWLYIDTAFTWENTPKDEGFDYWAELDAQWENIVKNLNLKKMKEYEDKVATTGD